MAGTITVAGLGASGLDQMTIGIYEQIKKAGHIWVRTENHPAIVQLKEQGVRVTALDYVYEKHDQFGPVYEEIADLLIQEAGKGDVLYAVPGHPLVAEQTVQLLFKHAPEKGIQLNIAGGKSFLDEMYTALQIDPIDGCQIVDGTQLKKEELQIRHHLIIVQVYDVMIASEVKLTLMEKYPDDYEVAVVTEAGGPGETITRVPLYELDHAVQLNNLTAVYVPPVKKEMELYTDFEFLLGVIAELRGPNGCPWDKKQTHQSLKKYLIEEAYEVLEAIDEEDDDHLAEELGDLLLQVLLHAQIGEDEGYFTIRDVIGSLSEKMIRRHPHVFGNVEADTAEEVVQNWETIKAQEKGKEERTSLLDGIAKGLPALQKSFKLQKKAAQAGFDWNDAEPMYDKLNEEVKEFQEALDEEERLNEMGDLLFTAVNLARYYKIDPEEALQSTNRKFYTRFRFIEEELAKEGLSPNDATLEKMDKLWNEAKRNFSRKEGF